MTIDVNLSAAEIVRKLMTDCSCDSCVAVLTDGRSFLTNVNTGQAFTGWWTAAVERIRQNNCVAVFHRPDPNSRRTIITVGPIADVYVNTENQVGIHFGICSTHDLADFNWHDLAGGANPVYYL